MIGLFGLPSLELACAYARCLGVCGIVWDSDKFPARKGPGYGLVSLNQRLTHPVERQDLSHCNKSLLLEGLKQPTTSASAGCVFGTLQFSIYIFLKRWFE